MKYNLTNISSAYFLKSATTPKDYPKDNFPEIAFTGRSNVGKSSLINALLQRNKLAKISRTPGKTRTINFFRINENITFVDLPGYGYAKVPEEVRKSWKPMVEKYLLERENLKAIILILDIRREPSEEDLELWNWLTYYKKETIPVITKIDKLSKNQRVSAIRIISERLNLNKEEFSLFSAYTKEGRVELLKRIEKAILKE